MKTTNCVTVLVALISSSGGLTTQAQVNPHSRSLNLTGRIVDLTPPAPPAPPTRAATLTPRPPQWQFLRPRAPHSVAQQDDAMAAAQVKSRNSAPANNNNNNGRSLRVGIVNGVKNFLTGGIASIEQRTGNIFWFGSNLLATLIPLASLLNLTSDTTSRNETTTTTTSSRRSSALSTLMSSLGGGGRGISSTPSVALHSRVEYVMGWLERSIEHLPNFPRLHPQECVKRSICEAHQEPERYGAIGLTLRLLFPATNHTPTDSLNNMEYKVINKYRHAAGYGMSRRLDNTTTTNNFNGSCKEKYEDCLVSLLEVGQNLVDFFLKN